MSLTPPVARVQMLIRGPAAEVFAAFVDPAITTRFWFTKSSGRVEPGAHLRWEWEMYGAYAEVDVKAVEPDARILVEWTGPGTPPCPVEWTFAARPDDTTLVTIANWGFQGTDDEVVRQAMDAVGGFSFVLAGLKALVEQGVVLHLVADHHPDAHRPV